MSLTDWLFTQHPFFRDMCQRLLDVITRENIKSLDHLVVSSRRPVRSVVLVLNVLIQRGYVEVTQEGIIATGSDLKTSGRAAMPQRIWRENGDLGNVRDQYNKMVAVREEPALLWGQRRLVPDSAFNRALYILTRMSSNKGSIAFLGDDDLVSPLVASAVSTWDVYVVDIDREVLRQAQQIASQLGARLSIHHTDLSEASIQNQGRFNIVVCDPFPSGDGSFESMFWQHAICMLQPEGELITTIAPSHKPFAYASGALLQLHNLGFCLIDLQADYGQYEVFDFEFIPFEKEVLTNLGLYGTVSHTKSLLTAKRLPNNSQQSDIYQRFDFAGWREAAQRHYLTHQAGADRQQQIAAERGIQGKDLPVDRLTQDHGLRVDLILPTEFRGKLSSEAVGNPERLMNSWADIFSQHLNVTPREDELQELARLDITSDIRTDGPLAQLGLAIRAIESWERWKFDE